MEKNKIVTVIGGSGFVGQYVVKLLAKQGYRVRVAVRNPHIANDLMVNGYVGQITAVQCNIRYYESVKKVIAGSDYVVNCVGILFEKGKQSFEQTQYLGAVNVAKACLNYNIKKLVHISAIGADEKSTSEYAQSKGKAEKEILKTFPHTTILRPSIIFGHEDNFFNLFAKIAGISPFLPLIGGGQTQFQPVYVVDVASAVLKSLSDDKTSQKTYELGGPRIFTFKAILEKIMLEIGKKRILIPMPFWLAKINAFFLQCLPSPLLTTDQVELLKSDNVVAGNAFGLSHLGIEPTDIDVVVPHYLHRYRDLAPYDFAKGYGYKSQRKV